MTDNRIKDSARGSVGSILWGDPFQVSRGSPQHTLSERWGKGPGFLLDTCFSRWTLWRFDGHPEGTIEPAFLAAVTPGFGAELEAAFRRWVTKRARAAVILLHHVPVAIEVLHRRISPDLSRREKILSLPANRIGLNQESDRDHRARVIPSERFATHILWGSEEGFLTRAEAFFQSIRLDLVGSFDPLALAAEAQLASQSETNCQLFLGSQMLVLEFEQGELRQCLYRPKPEEMVQSTNSIVSRNLSPNLDPFPHPDWSFLMPLLWRSWLDFQLRPREGCRSPLPQTFRLPLHFLRFALASMVVFSLALFLLLQGVTLSAGKVEGQLVGLRLDELKLIQQIDLDRQVSRQAEAVLEAKQSRSRESAYWKELFAFLENSPDNLVALEWLPNRARGYFGTVHLTLAYPESRDPAYWRGVPPFGQELPRLNWLHLTSGESGLRQQLIGIDWRK
jgi:hypothetical protein